MALAACDDGKGVVLIYATCPNEETAIAIARRCVTARLAACANIIAPMTSVYAWDGRIETASECSLIVKSTAEDAAACQAEIAAAHPYDVPAILILPVAGGHGPFLDWVRASVGALEPTQIAEPS